MTIFTSRVAEGFFWALAIVLLCVYGGLRGYGELERRAAIALFLEGRSPAAADTTAPHTRLVGFAHGTSMTAARARGSASPNPGAVAATPASVGSALAPSAVLRIARVTLEVPVYADTTERNLNRGAGLVAGTAAPGSDGNIAIAAHRDGYFRALEKVAVGDVVELETSAHNRRYRVTELTIVEPTDLWPLAATDAPAVTLVTCYPFQFVGSAPQRYIVRAVAMESVTSTHLISTGDLQWKRK